MSENKRKNLTCCEKAYIHGLKDGGMKPAEISRKLKKPSQTIHSVLRRIDKPPSKKSSRPVGRQLKLTERDIRGYIRYARKNKGATLAEIWKSGRPDVSKDVVRNALRNANLH